MADQTELRMNLAAVKRTDPYAVEIVETSAHVAFYTFNYEDNEWEKTDVEGAFFVYRRTAEPFHSIFINNRLNTESLVEPVTADLELQAQPPFLLYRNERSRIRGFWFYNKDELHRVANLVNKLVKECQKKSSAGAPPQPPASFLANFNMNGGGMNGGDQHKAGGQGQGGPVNIFSMLSKAQNDFDQSHNHNNNINNNNNPMPPMQQPRHPPQQPPMDGGSMLAALLPKMNVNGGGPGKDSQVTSQSVMNFFASAAKPTPQMPPTQQHPQMHPHQPVQPVPMQVQLHSNGSNGGPAGLKVASPAPPPLLQRLMSNPVTTVEQIEMQHRAVTPQAAQQKEQPQQQEKPPQPQTVAKENGFNWKANSGDKEETAKLSNGKDEMWPALLQQKGGPKGANKSAEAGGGGGEEKAGPNTARKGQQGKSQGAASTTAVSSAPKPALMTPTMFKKAEPLAKVDPTNPSLIPTGGKREPQASNKNVSTGKVASEVDLQIRPEPLTQSQMLQALTYLMKTDAEFIKKLHEAYVKSFAEMMSK